MTEGTKAPSRTVSLRRALSLPWLVFYGVGVTIGAGIFALIGEVLAVAGDHAPYAFLVAGTVAGFTAFSYAALSSAYPRAAGEVIYVKHGIGDWAGRLIGIGIIGTALASSSVISLAFAGYVASFSGLPEWISLSAMLVVLGSVAIAGVRQSVGLAAVITLLEVGTLLVVILVGLPQAVEGGALWRVLVPPLGLSPWMGVAAAAFLAFFAFIGFEDIVNMAEETEDAGNVVPRAVLWTLGISVIIYGLVAAVAASFVDREAIATSRAPLAMMFEISTGTSGAIIAVMASISMINGILVQIVMASRVVYGMANEGMLPAMLGRVHAGRQTPAIATAVITAAILLLSLTLPMLRLAALTSLIILAIFTAVNLSLYLLGRREAAPEQLRRWRFWGLAGALVSLALTASEVAGRH